jgi:CubicO group peptidase (beta-lactamase class C family)
LARDALATGTTAGLAIAVVRDGTVVFARGFGSSDLARQLPVTPDTVFAVGSLTKQFTAATVLLLMQDGKLGLDDRLARYEPRLPNADAITLRDLLNQTAGLHNYPFLTEHPWPLTGPIATDTILTILATDRPDFAPGTRWAYSNANYAALTGVVERVAGVPLSEVLQTRIFGPLGMTASGFGLAAQRRLAPATAYAGGPSLTVQDPISPDLFSGAGAMFSSARDLARWDTALLGDQLLEPASRALLFAHGALADGTPVDYGMGFVPATVDGHREVWHNGLAPGAGGACYNALFPDDRLAVVVLSNGYGFLSFEETLVRGIFRAYVPTTAAVGGGR